MTTEEIVQKIENKFKKINHAQQVEFHSVWKNAKIPEAVVRAHIKAHYKTERTSDLYRDQFVEFLKWAVEYQSKGDRINV